MVRITNLEGSTRDGFGSGIVAAAEKHPELIALCADLTESLRLTDFEKKYPERFIQVGVAEQNLVGVAAGLALGGKIPFAASYAVFSPGRSWDQFRVSACYSNLPVKLIGGHTGLSVGPDGATHQALEDLSLVLPLPNVTVVIPADAYQAHQATIALAATPGPAYLRLTRDKGSDVTSQADPFMLGKAQILKPGHDVTIFAVGMMVERALQAAAVLEKDAISVQVINLHTPKPLDKKTILKAAQNTRAFVVAEEHQQQGGVGSIIATFCSQNIPIPIEFVAIQDTFAESGSPSDLAQKYHLTSADIIKATWKVLGRKKK